MPLQLSVVVAVEAWPLREAFVISRGAKTEARVVVATVSDGAQVGRGEAVPYARYGETVEGVVEQIRSTRVSSRAALMCDLRPGAARNALDCALWDLEAKRSGKRVHELAGLGQPQSLLTAFTLSLGAPDDMATKARSVPHLSLLKLKLGGDGDDARMRAVRAARPSARLVADANEAWTSDSVRTLLDVAAETGFELIEQPLPAGEDALLAEIPHPVAVCADESVHTTSDLAALTDRYDAVNIKLDKAGGLTEALAMSDAARRLGLRSMVGCMVATSLAMAPAFIIAQVADWVDLDGPLLLAHDRPDGFAITDGLIAPPTAALWG